MKRLIGIGLLTLVLCGCVQSNPTEVLKTSTRLSVVETQSHAGSTGTRYSIIKDKDTEKTYLIVEKVDHRGGIAIIEMKQDKE